MRVPWRRFKKVLRFPKDVIYWFNVLLYSSLFFMALFELTYGGVNIRLTWDPNTEPDLAGYKIYYGNASRVYTHSINVGKVTSYTLNLDPRNRYYIAVTAYDTENLESGFSNEVRWPYLNLVDFEGDGKNDIAVYRSSIGAWFVRPSSGASPFGVGWGGDPFDKPVAGDFDGDGNIDLVVSNSGSNTIGVRLGNGNGTFRPQVTLST
ncbi:MAG: hypothetical protein N2Z74_06945, partial [Syntrophales bacterium]|nr:hypothetical protein [Syntrophales bacterium]